MAANKLTLSLRSYTMQEDHAGNPRLSSLWRRRSWIGTSTFEVRNDQPATDRSFSDGNSLELSESADSVTLAESGASTLTFNTQFLVR